MYVTFVEWKNPYPIGICSRIAFCLPKKTPSPNQDFQETKLPPKVNCSFYWEEVNIHTSYIPMNKSNWEETKNKNKKSQQVKTCSYISRAFSKGHEMFSRFLAIFKEGFLNWVIQRVGGLVAISCPDFFFRWKPSPRKKQLERANNSQSLVKVARTKPTNKETHIQNDMTWHAPLPSSSAWEVNVYRIKFHYPSSGYLGGASQNKTTSSCIAWKNTEKSWHVLNTRINRSWSTRFLPFTMALQDPSNKTTNQSYA